jgi:hypothetical protein
VKVKYELKDSGPYLSIRPFPEYRARFWNKPAAADVDDLTYGYHYLEWQLSDVRDVHEALRWVDARADEYEEYTLYACGQAGDDIWLQVSGTDPNRQP